MKTYGEEGKGTTGGLMIFAVFALAGRSVSSNQVLLIYPRAASANEYKMSQNQGRNKEEEIHESF